MKSVNSFMLFMLLTYAVKAGSAIINLPFDVSITGKGEQAILFIPGFSCSGEVWNETRATYEKNFKCYTLTMAGFAGVPPQDSSTFKNWETSIADYIKQNRIEKPVLIGHSMGGVLALSIAADYPDLIKKIIVIDGLPCLAALMNPDFKSVGVPACSEIINQITSISKKDFYQQQKNAITMLVADTTKQELIIDWGVKSDRKTVAGMYCDFLNTDLREKLKMIQCPSLILLEANFKNMKPVMEEQYKNLKSANLQYADKGLHFIMFDDRDWYMNQVTNFLIEQ